MYLHLHLLVWFILTILAYWGKKAGETTVISSLFEVCRDVFTLLTDDEWREEFPLYTSQKNNPFPSARDMISVKRNQIKPIFIDKPHSEKKILVYLFCYSNQQAYLVCYAHISAVVDYNLLQVCVFILCTFWNFESKLLYLVIRTVSDLRICGP